jgi:hypothetical protein
MHQIKNETNNLSPKAINNNKYKNFITYPIENKPNIKNINEIISSIDEQPKETFNNIPMKKLIKSWKNIE